MQRDTEKIKIHYSHFSQSFKRSFLRREERNEVFFNDLSVVVQNLFDFEDKYIESFETDTRKLLLKILELQSYLNFDLLKAVIDDCGIPEDIEEAKKYTEAFTQYAKRRIFECDDEVLSKELPQHETVMFVLDINRPIRLIDVDIFKEYLSELVGIQRYKIILHKFEGGSIIISIQVPSKYVKSFSILPLLRSRMLSLQEWCVRSLKFRNEVVHLDHWNVLNSVDFGSKGILCTANAEIVRATLNDAEYLALKYNENISDETTADTGYITYLDRFCSGKYKNLPAVKGVYYHSETYHYPFTVVENLKSLKEMLSITQEVSQVTQISILSDITCSVASFESDQGHQVSVFPDSVFVQDSVDPDSELTACFCPLYGHSFHIKKAKSQDQQTSFLRTSLPLEQLQWMSDVIKYIHFQGNVTADTELPEDHILKRLFDQKWISKEARFRPKDFKVLSEELQHLLGMYCNLLY